MTRVSVFIDGKQYYEEQWVMPLLTESPMSHVRIVFLIASLLGTGGLFGGLSFFGL